MSFCFVSCGDDDDDKGGGAVGLQGAWGLVEYYSVYAHGNNQYVEEAAGTPEEVMEQTGMYCYLVFNLNGAGGNWTYEIGQQGDPFNKWECKDGRLYLYFADDSGYDADFFNITFKDENTFVLEEEYRDGSEYEYEKAVFKRM